LIARRRRSGEEEKVKNTRIRRSVGEEKV